MMKKTVLLLFALLALVFSIAAQESVEKMYSEYGDNSIIREAAHGNWIVYSNPYGYCDFSRVIEGSNTNNILRLPDDFSSVSDFEIDRDIVYFCGKMKDGVPCMGYFSIGGTFPNSQINYLRLTSVDQVLKLEVMSDNIGAQVIMTGVSNQRGVIVDAVSTAPTWQVNYIKTFVGNPDSSYRYRDLVILDSFIVVTSFDAQIIRDEEEFINFKSYLWYFRKPSISTIPLSLSSVFRVDILNQTLSEMLIKKCENNSFVIAGSDFLNRPIVAGYNGFSHIGSISLIMPSSKIRDLVYSSFGKSTELVVDKLLATDVANEIYTLLPGMVSVPGIAYGRSFSDHRINSIVCRSDDPSKYICVGGCIGDNSNLYVFKYLYNLPKGCSTLVSVETKVLEWVDRFWYAYQQSTTQQMIAYKKNPIEKMTNLDQVCYRQ